MRICLIDAGLENCKITIIDTQTGDCHTVDNLRKNVHYSDLSELSTLVTKKVADYGIHQIVFDKVGVGHAVADAISHKLKSEYGFKLDDNGMLIF